MAIQVDPDTAQVYPANPETIRCARDIMQQFDSWAKNIQIDYSVPVLSKGRKEHNQTVVETLTAARAKLLNIVKQETGL